MEKTILRSDSGSFGHILKGFSISLLISFLATLFASQFLGEVAISALVIIELIMIISTIFVRLKGKQISYTFVYMFSAVSGATLYPVIAYYGNSMGANLVSLALAVTFIIFSTLSIYAYRSKRDFSSLGGFLVASLFGLIAVAIASIFFEFGPVVNLIYAGVGVLIFSGFVLYDVSEYKEGVEPGEVPLAILNMYLNFMNLFLFVLRFIASIVASRD